MNTGKRLGKSPASLDRLFERVVAILEQARAEVVRSVNSQMVAAYWLIGQEIVQELQRGQKRAEYGKRLIGDLADRLTKRYGEGYSAPTLWNLRQFYLAYVNRRPQILYPAGRESLGAETLFPKGRESVADQKSRPLGDLLEMAKQSFHPNLSWSHYRALMRVENEKARDFYETESVRCGWDKRDLERQISTLFYERLLKSGDKSAMLRQAASGNKELQPIDVLKNPYILEFLNLPNTPGLRESKLEDALIANLQYFLLELGKGFAFVARQKHLRIGSKDFFVDLVFYNYLLKCFLLIDLKVGDLTHQDIGQMDGYVRLFEERCTSSDDNPTIGLILCSDTDDAIVHYSVLKESQKLFASRYKLILPDEEELRQEIERERRLIENARDDHRNLGRSNTRKKKKGKS